MGFNSRVDNQQITGNQNYIYKNNAPIDIVLPWVDDADLLWQDERDKYASGYGENPEALNIRFQSWENLHLWFRAIEECMPWYNRIFLITCGQRPDFLDDSNPRVVLVDHKDFIPDLYLPTFNSNTIEMNIHRIEALSENYILFSDDVFPLQYIDEEYYFMNDMVCDEAVENIISTGSFTSGLKWMRYSQINNMFIINKYFKKREVQARHPELWFNECYEEHLERTRACEYWYDFPGFYDPHMANAMKKSVLTHLWEIEPKTLDEGSKNRFRGYSDVTQYLVRYWQFCSGNFIPRKTRGKVYFPTIDTYQDVVDVIDKLSYPMISFNENCSVEEFDIIKRNINVALQRRFPNKCSFER